MIFEDITRFKKKCMEKNGLYLAFIYENKEDYWQVLLFELNKSINQVIKMFNPKNLIITDV